MSNLVDINDRFIGSYGQWLKVQLSGWDTQASFAMVLNYGFYLMTAIVGLINWKPVSA